MSLRLLVPALLGLALPACGTDAGPSARFNLDVVMERAVAEDIHALQISVVTEGSRRSCAELQRTCLARQVERDELVVLKDSEGNEGRALRIPVDLESLQAGSGQALVVEVPVGRDYALVIEALAQGAPPRFLGSSCTYLKEVNAGDNAPVIAASLVLTDEDCDPTIAP